MEDKVSEMVSDIMGCETYDVKAMPYWAWQLAERLIDAGWVKK